MLHPDLIAEFIAEYQKEYNLLMLEETKGRRAMEKELATVTRQIDQIILAISDGMYHPSMKAKMSDLEARKQVLATALGAQAEQPLRLHPCLAEVYRKKVADLTAALTLRTQKPKRLSCCAA